MQGVTEGEHHGDLRGQIGDAADEGEQHAQQVQRAAHRLGAEEDPGQADELEGEETGQEFPPPRRRMLAAGRALNQAGEGHRHAVHRAPQHEFPLGAVPQAAQEHRQPEIQIGAPGAVPAAAQRNVQVVAEPGRQTDVPAPPEVARVQRDVRPVEVERDFIAQQQRRADGDVRIAGKIAVDLHRVAVDRRQHLPTGVHFGQRKHAVDQIDRQEIGDDHLLEQPGHNQPQRAAAFLLIQARLVVELRQQVGGAHDRPGDKLREEAHVQQVFVITVRRLQLAAIQVDDVAHHLEGVKADADGQDHVQPQPDRIEAEPLHRLGNVDQEKVGVFENRQNAEVHRDRHGQQQLAFETMVGQRHRPAEEEIQRRGKPDQQQERGIPIGVEEIRGGQQKQHPHQAQSGQRPKQDEDHNQKNAVLHAIE